jgi:diaminohydroxyphosphoribosylaminopyrimidine deaminase/5-amino-6-(5-phosphoribosylamino)uracil reductase
MGKRVHITSAASDRVVHALRARCDAIAVGTNTVLNDDPLLTARGVESNRALTRVVLSNSLKIPLESRLVQSAVRHPLILYSSARSVEEQQEVVQRLTGAGVEVVALPTKDENRFSFSDVLADLYPRGVTHLLVEPGPTLCRCLLARRQVDRVWVFHSPKLIEDAQGFGVSSVPSVDYPISGTVALDGDQLVEQHNPKSNVFFANAASADLVLSQS